MAGGKWIDGLAADMPLAEAARLVLDARLQVVREYLGLALTDWERSPEYVHQLRVGSRRTGAALRIFASCLPEKKQRAARHELKRLRKAVGEVRDWDVFLLNLADQVAKNGNHAGRDLLLGYGTAQRLLAQQHLHQTVPEYPDPLDRLCDRLLSSVRSPKSGAARLGDLAGPGLRHLLARLDDAVAQDLNDYEHLHRVRILGKRLRYAMEVFAPCFDEDFREVHYPVVEEMQDILGKINDSYVACGWLSDLRDRLQKMLPADWPRLRPDIDAVLEFHRQRLPRERMHFEEWWRQWQETGGKTALGFMLHPAAAA